MNYDYFSLHFQQLLTRRMTETVCIFTVPEIEIVDERDKNVAEKSYEGGSTIQLKCLVSQIVDEPPEYIIWHHEDRMLNYDTERGGIRYWCMTSNQCDQIGRFIALWATVYDLSPSWVLQITAPKGYLRAGDFIGVVLNIFH